MKRRNQIKAAILALVTMTAFQNCKLIDNQLAFNTPDARDISRLHFKEGFGFGLPPTPEEYTSGGYRRELEVQAPQVSGWATAVYHKGKCRIAGSIPGADYNDLAKLVAESEVVYSDLFVSDSGVELLEVITRDNSAWEYHLAASDRRVAILKSAAAIKAQLQKISDQLLRAAGNCPAPQPTGLTQIRYDFESGYSVERRIQQLVVDASGLAQYSRESSLSGRCSVKEGFSAQEFQQLARLTQNSKVIQTGPIALDSARHSITTRDLAGVSKRYSLYQGSQPGDLILVDAAQIKAKLDTYIQALEKRCGAVNSKSFARLNYKFLGGFGVGPREVKDLNIQDLNNASEWVRATLHNGNCPVTMDISKQEFRDISNLIRSSTVTVSSVVAADAAEITVTTFEHQGPSQSYVLGIPFASKQLQLSRSSEIRAKFEAIIKKINSSVACKVLH